MLIHFADESRRERAFRLYGTSDDSKLHFCISLLFFFHFASLSPFLFAPKSSSDLHQHQQPHHGDTCWMHTSDEREKWVKWVWVKVYGKLTSSSDCSMGNGERWKSKSTLFDSWIVHWLKLIQLWKSMENLKFEYSRRREEEKKDDDCDWRTLLLLEQHKRSDCHFLEHSSRVKDMTARIMNGFESIFSSHLQSIFRIQQSRMKSNYLTI